MSAELTFTILSALQVSYDDVSRKCLQYEVIQEHSNSLRYVSITKMHHIIIPLQPSKTTGRCMSVFFEVLYFYGVAFAFEIFATVSLVCSRLCNEAIYQTGHKTSEVDGIISKLRKTFGI